MSTSVAYRNVRDSAPKADRTGLAVHGLSPEILSPLLEGARARGLADAFELVGLPVVLIDAGGAILHVGAGAAARMGASIAVVSRHLVGTDSASNRALQDLVAAALAGEAKTVTVKVPGTASELAVRAIPMPQGWDNPGQLLKAVIVFGEVLKTIDEWVFGD